MSETNRKRIVPGTYFWILIAILVLGLIVGFMNAVFYKGDTGQTLGHRGTNSISNKNH
jgi:hypothetical protein